MPLTAKNECYSCIHKRTVPGNCHIKCNNPDYNIQGNSHGIMRGWFAYPFCFDPIWKESMCENFEEKR